MADSGFMTLEERIDRLEERIDQLSDMVVRLAEDLDAGFADVRKTSDQEFKQLKQAILFWGGRTRALDDRDNLRRRP